MKLWKLLQLVNRMISTTSLKLLRIYKATTICLNATLIITSTPNNKQLCFFSINKLFFKSGIESHFNFSQLSRLLFSVALYVLTSTLLHEICPYNVECNSAKMEQSRISQCKNDAKSIYAVRE